MASANSAQEAPSLEATFEVKDGSLRVRALVHNPGKAPIFVFDRLWTLENGSRPIADPEQAYRFVTDRQLRLYLGAAPLPRSKSTMFQNIPYATEVAGGSSQKIELAVPIPVKEYSCYFDEDVPETGYESVDASSVQLVVQYLPGSDDLPLTPSPFDPEAVKIDLPGALDHAATLQTPPHPMQLEVLRRRDDFTRLALPGEPLEPFGAPGSQP